MGHNKLKNIGAYAHLILLVALLIGSVVAQAEECSTAQSLIISGYSVDFVGLDDPELQTKIESSSRLLALQKRPPKTTAMLERRTKTDLQLFRKILRAEGYYKGKLSYRLDDEMPDLKITITVDSGPRYKLLRYRVEYTGPNSTAPYLPWRSKDYAPAADQPATSQLVIKSRKSLLAKLGHLGHPHASLIHEDIVVDHKDQSMRVRLQIDPGSRARFGTLTIQGMVDVKPDYLEALVPWTQNEMFDSRKIDQFRNELLATSLFDTVAIEYPEQSNIKGQLPITVRLTERKHRSIELGLRWSTDKGIETSVGWENRNIFGRQESIRIAAQLGEIKQEVDGRFIKPHFLQSRQNLLVNAALAHEDAPGYRGPLTRFLVSLQRPIPGNWNVFAGLPIEYSKLSDFNSTRTFFLLGLEARAELDTSNDRFNPTEGTRLNLSLKPYTGWGDDNVTFVNTEAIGTAYFDPTDAQNFVLAGRIKIGSIAGESTTALPANKRYYAGGGNSIRGYSFQLAGPLGLGGTPLGGRSVFELNTELRVKITDSIGAVVFLDGGNVYDGELPDLFGSQLWAAGFGVRYFTAVGPLRLDFGFPLNRRDGIDDVLQFYISVGQAF